MPDYLQLLAFFYGTLSIIMFVRIARRLYKFAQDVKST